MERSEFDVWTMVAIDDPQIAIGENDTTLGAENSFRISLLTNGQCLLTSLLVSHSIRSVDLRSELFSCGLFVVSHQGFLLIKNATLDW